MTRSTMVSFLVEHKHPFLTRELELRLSTFVYETNYSDVSDEAIAELFSAFPEHFSSFINVDSDEYVDEKGLTETGRLIIRKLLDDALNYKCELIAMDDDVFEQLHDDVECMALNKEKAKKTRSGTARDRWDFFNRQKAKADPSFWQRATAFTP